MAAYTHIPQIQNTIRRLMSLGFVPLPLVWMCLGNLQLAPHRCKFKLLHWQICSCFSGITAPRVRFNTDFYTFSVSVETFGIWPSRDLFCTLTKKIIQQQKVTKKYTHTLRYFFIRFTKELNVSVISICVSCYIIYNNGNLYLLRSLANYSGYE